MAQKRSRTTRKIRIKTPAGRRAIHYRRRKRHSAECARCGRRLHGMNQARGTAASKRNPSRPYGGVLCSSCTRTQIKSTVR